MGKATDARELWGPIHRYIYWQRWTLKNLMSPLLTSTVYWLRIEFRVYSEGISNTAHGANCKHDWNPVHPHDVGRQQLALWRDHICACKSGMLPRSGDSCPFPDMVLCVWSHAPALFLCTYVYKSNQTSLRCSVSSLSLQKIEQTENSSIWILILTCFIMAREEAFKHRNIQVSLKEDVGNQPNVDI